MPFGDHFKQEGWTIVTLSPRQAIDLQFEPDSSIQRWLSETVPDNKWQRVSFRRLAFRDAGIAVLFKLVCC